MLHMTMASATRRKVTVAAAAVAALSMLVGCAGQPQSSSTSTLVVVDADFPANFDTDSPAGGTTAGENVVGNVYGGDIFGFDHTVVDGVQVAEVLADGMRGGISDGFAKNVDISEDGKTITVELRDDVISSHGNPLIAEDVVWSYERNFALGQTGLFMAQSMGLNSPDQVVALDEHTVQFQLDAPNSIFFKVNAAKLYSGLVDSVEVKKHVTEGDPWALDWLAKNTAGYGAYQIGSFQEGQSLTLVKNPNYEGSTDVEQVVWRNVPTSANRLALLQSGEADIAMNLSPEQLRTAQEQGLSVTSYESNKIKVMPMNAEDPALSNVQVRQAIAYAIPYDDILSGVFLGTGTELKSPLPAIYPGYTDEFDVYQTNLDKARELMASAGVDSLDLTLTYSNDSYEDPLIAPIISAALADIGINVTLEGLPSSSYYEKLYSRSGQMYLAQFQPFVADPAYALGVYFKSDSFLNVGSWANEEFDGLISGMLLENDSSKRNEMALRAQQIWMEEQPWALLANPGWHVAHAEHVKDVTWYPNNGLRFADITFANRD